MLPRVTEVASQHQLVECHGVIHAEERIVECRRSILILKHESERVLGILLGQSAMPTMQSESAVYGHIIISGGLL